MGLFLFFTGCDTGESTGKSGKGAGKIAPKKGPAGKPVLVELATVQRGSIEEVLERSAALQAEEQVLVLARTQNPAVELLVEEGDLVEKDQILLRLENDAQKTAHTRANTDLNKARIEYERVDQLYTQSLISESDFVNAKFAYDQAKLVEEEARRQLEFTEVRAPIKGTITSRTVKVGDKVTTGTPIFEIIDLDSTVAVIHVPEQYLPKLRKGMKARLFSGTLGDKVFDGFVKRISPIVDADAGTVKVVVGLDELGALSPGMWVNVELILQEKQNALLIPKRAITYSVDQTFAFKTYTDEEGQLRAQRQLVEPLNVDKDFLEPKEGFIEGDLIVVAGHGALKDGAAVREVSEPKPDSNASANESLKPKKPLKNAEGAAAQVKSN